MIAVKKTRARGKLSRELIETTAFEVIEREGLDGFSTRKLAQALGCEAMSIYHHFPSKAHLFEALVDRVIGSLKPPPEDLPWRERMRISMEDFRAAGRKYPAFARFLITYRMNSPTCLAWLDRTIALVSDGFDEEQGARLFRVIGYFLAGAILDETAGYATGPSAITTVSEDRLPHDFPNVAAAGRFFAPSQFDATFKVGLNMLLDAMERERRAGE
jgi:AcrR family transcriptional regulator